MENSSLSHEGQIIYISNTCQAGCNHCPYGVSNQIRDSLDINMIIQKIESSDRKLIILTGGEPLESPFFMELLDRLRSSKKLFRIATGGHIPIQPSIEKLMTLPYFTGFSLGTDILIPERNDKASFKANWLKNLFSIVEWKIHYSLTITLGSEIKLQELLKKLIGLGCNPDFFTLSEKEEEPLSITEWKIQKEIINIYYPHAEIIPGFVNNPQSCKN